VNLETKKPSAPTHASNTTLGHTRAPATSTDTSLPTKLRAAASNAVSSEVGSYTRMAGQERAPQT
jgi:hypothetical protein